LPPYIPETSVWKSSFQAAIRVLNSSDLALNLSPNRSELGSLPPSPREPARDPSPPPLARARGLCARGLRARDCVRAAVARGLHARGCARAASPCRLAAESKKGRGWVQEILVSSEFRERFLFRAEGRRWKVSPFSFSPQEVKTFLYIYLFTKIKRVRSHLTKFSFLGSIHPPPHHTLSKLSSYLSNTTRLIIF